MRKRILSLMLALTFVFSTSLPVTSLADAKKLNVSRIAGADRIETAVKASQATFKNGSENVVVASGDDFPDALVGGTLATQINAPILLVSKNSVSSLVSSEIKRLKANKVYLLGGTNTIASSVESKIKSGGVEVERLAGKDRYWTAHAIAEKRFELHGETIYFDDYATFNGNNFADALSAAPFVGQQNHLRMLPYQKNGKPSGIVFGGTSSVPKMVDSEIRYAGANREATAVEVAKAYKTELKQDIDTVVLVDGYDFPDALSSAPVASINNGAVLLTNSKTLSKETKAFIDNNDNIKNIIIVGGENSVSANIEKELKGEVTATQTLYDVVRVKDGDTIVVKLNGKDETVRFLLVDTPESVHSDSSKNTPYGKIASDYTKKLLEGKKVSLEFDVAERDHYGRLLAYVYLEDGRMVNEMLLKEGHAKVTVFQPNIKYINEFRALEKEAQANKKGIWADGVSAFEPNNNTQTSPSTDNNSSTDLDKLYVDSNGRGLIKGNINAKGEKIYHIPNKGSYNSTQINTSAGERWFKTEREAQNAGWRKADNIK